MTTDAIPSEIGMIVLQTCRIGGLITASPLPWKEAPVRVRAGLVVVLAFLAHGIELPDRGPGTLQHLFLAIPTEVLIGVAMGMVVRIAFSAADVAADMVGPLFGLAVPSVFDPMNQSHSTVLSRILGLLMMTLALLVGVHRILLGSVLASFRILPPGAAVDPSVAALPLLKMVAAATLLGLRLALPMAAVLLMTHVALAFLSRAAPAMQIFSVGFSLSIVVGAAILVVSLPDIAGEMSADLSSIGSRVEVLLVAFMGR